MPLNAVQVAETAQNIIDLGDGLGGTSAKSAFIPGCSNCVNMLSFSGELAHWRCILPELIFFTLVGV